MKPPSRPPRPGRASRAEDGARADLRGGLQAVQLRLPPGRRAQDAIAEIHYFISHSYEWVFEADITACFDEISQSVQDRLRAESRTSASCDW